MQLGDHYKFVLLTCRSGRFLPDAGVQYPTEVVPLPTTLAVAHLAGATLVVDSLLNTALRAERVHSVEEESAMMGVHEMEYAPDGLSEGEMADDEAGRKRGGKAVGGRGKRGALAGRSGVKRRQKKAPAAKKGRAARKKKP